MNCRFAFATLLTFASMLSAEEPKPNATPASATQEDAVQLSEFTVVPESDRGYAASETMSGPRVKTKIMDLPYSVTVITSEFFEDFAMFDLDDSLTQVGSFTGLSGAGTFTFRGFSSSYQLRDGFYRIGRYGTSNIDRVEFIRGSSAAVYGRSSPGGMINMISKQPRAQTGARITLNFGDYGTRRAVLESTGTLAKTSLGQTTYLLTASTYQRHYQQPFTRNRHQEYMGTIKHVFKDGSTLLLQGEYFFQTQHGPPSAAPLVVDQKGTASNTDDVAIGYATPLAYYSPYGPHSEFDRDYRTGTLTYDKKLTDVWSLRIGANEYRDHSWQANRNTNFGTVNINPPPSATNPTSTPTTTRGVPAKQLFSEDGGCVQADFLAHTWLAHGKVESRTLLTIDFNDYYRWDPNWSIGTSANNPLVAAWSGTAANPGPAVIRLGPDLTPLSPLGYFPVTWSWGTESIVNVHHNRQTVLGGLVSQQAAFFKGRLLTYAGVRYDMFRYRGRDFRTPVTSFNKFPGYENYQIGDQVRRSFTELKPNAGINYRVFKNYRAFVNYSESYSVNQGDAPAVVADPTYKAEVAHGWDYGIKGGLLDDHLTFTLCGFYAVRQNVQVSELVETTPGNYTTQNVRDGDQLVRGYEWDVNWKMTSELNLVGSWGHVYSIYTNFGSANPLAVGRRVANVSPENGGISLRYAPRTWLRGFSANVGYTYVGRTPTESPNAGDTYTTDAQGSRILQRTTRQWALSVPALSLWNVGARYTFRTGNRWDQQIGVNVNNVMDRRYLRTSQQAGDRRAVYVTYSLGFGGLRR